MKHLLSSLAFALALSAAAYGQQVQTLFTISGEAGYLTNAYLDPDLPVWERSVRAPFAALSPTLQLAWSGRRTELAVQGRGRYMRLTGTTGSWWLGQGQVHLERSLSGRWAAGVDGVGSAWEATSSQLLLWAMPYLRYSITPRLRVGLRAGASWRREVAAAGLLYETSSFGMLEAEMWPDSRWRWQGRLYYNHAGTADMSGLGLVLTASYWLRKGSWLSLQAGTDQFGYPAMSGGVSTEMQMDRSWHAGTSIDLPLSTRWAITTRLGLLYYQSASPLEQPHDFYVGTGLRWTLHRTRSLQPAPAPLWVQEGRHVRFQLHRKGRGRLYLVGDFNDWEQPGIPLEAGSGSSYSASLLLEPGTYQYKLQVVEGGEMHWLPLPEQAVTVEDGFGGTNGLLIVQ